MKRSKFIKNEKLERIIWCKKCGQVEALLEDHGLCEECKHIEDFKWMRDPMILDAWDKWDKWKL